MHPSLTHLLQVRAQLLSRIRLSTTPRTIARQAPLSMGFLRQEYWSGLLFETVLKAGHSGSVCGCLPLLRMMSDFSLPRVWTMILPFGN